MCLSAKSSCLGNILSICLEETAADVRRPRAAVVMDAPRFRILHWSFQTTRVLSLRCLHGALGFTDLAKKIPQDLAQLCISKSLRKTSLQKTKQTVDALSSPHSAEFPPLRLMRFLQETLPTPSKLQSLYNCTVAQERTNQSGDAAWRSEESGQTAAKLSHVHARPRWKRWGTKKGWIQLRPRGFQSYVGWRIPCHYVKSEKARGCRAVWAADGRAWRLQ